MTGRQPHDLVFGQYEVAPTALDTNVGLIDTPGLIGWLEMMAQPFLQFGTVALVETLHGS